MTGVIPPGGWQYPEGENTVRGDTHEDLIAKLTAYRIANQIVLGNPEQDIERYVCQQFPSYCGTDSNQLPPPRTAPRTFRERVTSWAANRYQYAGGIELEDEETAEARAQVCVNCPSNQEWRAGCPPCIAATERTLLVINQNRKTKTVVLGCAIAGHENQTACYLPPKHLKHKNQYLSQLPPRCWMLALSE